VDYFDYLEPETGDFDVEEFLEQSQEDQKQRLEEELERIQDQLEQRERLHDEIIKELKSKRDWYLQRLTQEYSTPGKSDVKELKQEVKRLYSELRSEKQQHWQDTQELERERRELLKELSELDQPGFEELI